MTPKELYEWAVDNCTEDHEMVFLVEVGNETVELSVDSLERTGSRFEMKVNLY